MITIEQCEQTKEVRRVHFLNNWIQDKASSYKGRKTQPGVGQVVLNAPESVREKLRTLKSEDLNYYRTDIIMGMMTWFDGWGLPFSGYR